ncbi:hypothetical protein ACFQ88_13825 [Paenibacillus sp. NPDC056579]
MKRTVQCEQIILQLSIAPELFELWKRNNLSMQPSADKKPIDQPTPKKG